MRVVSGTSIVILSLFAASSIPPSFAPHSTSRPTGDPRTALASRLSSSSWLTSAVPKTFPAGPLPIS